MDEVTPNEIARTLGVTGLTVRNWLRSEKVAGHPLLAGHEYRTRYRFTRQEADQLAAEYRARRAPPGHPPHRRASPGGRVPPSPCARARLAPRFRDDAQPSDPDDAMANRLSDEPGHRMTETWMGRETLTLADLLRPGLRAVVVGINPSPVSVAAATTTRASSASGSSSGWTRPGSSTCQPPGSRTTPPTPLGSGSPTSSSARPARHRLHPGELQHGRELLDRKLAPDVPKVLFTFKGAQRRCSARWTDPASRRTLAGAEVFVMPGPMAASAITERVLDELRDWWGV